MGEIETYRERFAESGWEIFERAVGEAKRRGQNRVGVEHVLHALLQLKAEYFTSLLLSLSDNQGAVEMLAGLVEEKLSSALVHKGPGVRVSQEAIDLFRRTLRRVRQNFRQRMEATDLFISLVLDEKSLLRSLLADLLADPAAKKKQRADLFALIESGVGSVGLAGKAKFQYAAGERVRIKSGPFAAFTGLVETVDAEMGLLTVRVQIMGRERPVQIRFVDAEKIDFKGL